MTISNVGFIQPKRRLTRQRSGFNVGGIKTGSECKILRTKHLEITTNHFELHKKIESTILTKLFGENIGILGAGGYFKSSKNILFSVKINLIENGSITETVNKDVHAPANHWVKVGADIELLVENEAQEYEAEISISFNIDNPPVNLEFFGLCADDVKYYAEKPTYKTTYYEKTELYKPEIYYLDAVDYDFDNAQTKELESGFIVCKSCNRCSRFLPIDITDENNALGFSNHCKKKAPCIHNAFSRYKIENPENIALITPKYKDSMVVHEGAQYIRTHYGFQLECRTCKKFVVNAPLNPLRNKAQHHEDGARRRAFERLIMELTGQDIVKQFRVVNGVEYQDYIWNKFSRKCFGCGKDLKKITDMDIDHTLPLVYLWPLDASATALCSTCNSMKHELFPSEFKKYQGKLAELSKLTGIPLKVLASKERIVNKSVVDLLVSKVEWFFDDFLARKDYQKIKKGKKVADLIYKALNKILTTVNIDLIEIYKERTNRLPRSITLASR